MAVVAMKKLTLVAHTKDKRKIMKTLTGLGTTEISVAAPYENTDKRDDAELRAGIERKLSRLNFAFSFLKQINNSIQMDKTKERSHEGGQGDKLNLGKENRLIDYDEMVTEVTENEYDLFNVVGGLEEANADLTDIKTDTARLSILCAQLGDYTGFDIKFSDIRDTKYTAVFAGLVPQEKKEDLASGLPESAAYEHYSVGKNEAVFIVVNKHLKEEAAAVLAEAGFVKCPFDSDTTAEGALASQSQRLRALEESRSDIIKKTAECFKYAPQLKTLYDYYYLELAKLDALAKTSTTQKAFVLEGWIPSGVAELTAGKIKEASPSVELFLTEPSEGETVPSYTRNSKIVSAFGNNITAMFGSPKYGERDPNPFVAFFYFLFFGFMLSDAGYGIMMAAACFIYLLVKKPVKNSGSFILMFGLCGISTVIWGAIFGGWFGIESQYLENNAIGRFLLSLKLIDPLTGSQALIMFGLALGLGAVQIAVGYFLNGLSKLKTNPLDGILNDFSWVVIFIGLGVYLLSMLPGMDGASTAGMVVLLVGVGMLIFGGAVGKKNPFKMLTGALKNVYGSINVFSDILSYARLFGLGLTTGVIGMVVNKIGLLLIDMIPIAGYIAAIAVFLVGHTFNLFINVLGVYVHNSRLQYVEFFGKFYSGEGHAFNPLGAKTKYVYLNDKLQTNNSTK